ncbi:MAG: MraY family glycosyltransferase, partial [Noviherbaspirillum sp.]
ASLPCFLVGLIEDLTKKVSAMTRLLATFSSALAACWLLDAYLSRLDTWGLDSLLQLMPFALVVTAIAVAGVANSINIIDGFHGVAGSAVAIILAAMGFLAWQTGDIFVTKLALLGIGATLGFLVVNYPTGRLFMGDGGAYFLGFWAAEVAVLLVARNPGVNAWQVLAVCAYPVIEVLYSIYRRRVIRKTSPGAPDRLHLHTLIYRRVVCQLIPRNHDRPWIRNAAVVWIVGTLIAAMAVIAVWLGDTIPAAVAVVIAETVLYAAVYARLVRGRWDLNPGAALGRRSHTAMRESP